MASVDKAAIGWSIAIVAVATGIAMAGLPTDTGFAPFPSTPTTSDSKIEAAKQQIEMEQKLSQEKDRAQAMEEQKDMVGEVPQSIGPMTIDVTIPTGTSVPGCEETNECYLPQDVSINVGDTVIWNNVDTAAHTVTSGSPTDGPDGVFDSSLVMASATFEVTFDDSGSYDYFCMVHPWMKGNVQVS